MSVLATDEHVELQQLVRRFLERHSDEAAVRELMATDAGCDSGVWHQLAEQLGLVALIVPEEFGGQGYGFRELAVVSEEMGRALFCGPYLATIMATFLLLAQDDDSSRRRYLPEIAAGRLTATVALAESGGRWDEAGVQTTALRTDDGWTLRGEKRFVLDGSSADLILVAARTPAGVSIFALDPAATGVSIEALPTMDLTRKQSEIRLSEAPARLIGSEGSGWPALAGMLDLTGIALAAEQVGGAARALELAVAYAKLREQFGRPIGSFQAIKHRCADMLLSVESARSALHLAVEAATTDAPDLTTSASVARIVCSQAFSYVATEAVQIFGGVGFTWECPAQLYLKRSISSELLFASPGQHRERIARILDL